MIDEPAPASGIPDAQAVEGVHEGFYAAFEARDLDAMSDLWVHDDEVTCTHPGWATLRGWAEVSSSWFAIFQGPQALQFIVTDVRVRVLSDVAWVTADENLIGDGGATGSTVAALNVFTRTPVGWRMVAHHGSPVADRS